MCHCAECWRPLFWPLSLILGKHKMPEKFKDAPDDKDEHFCSRCWSWTCQDMGWRNQRGFAPEPMQKVYYLERKK